MRKKTYLMLGRTGDILNLLPAIEHEADTYGYKPKLVVANAYADVLDGFSYVEKVVYPGHFSDLMGALEYARIKDNNEALIICSVYGKNYTIKKTCSSFLREAWHYSLCPKAWGHLTLNVDQRNENRESKLLYELGVEENKKIVVTALSGHSSPLSGKDKLLSYLRTELSSDYQIIDISEVKAYRIYDLLALYEIAHVLIANDSSPLHLANAVPDLPVISLISDLKDRWHESSWRPQHKLRVMYSELESRYDKIIDAVIGGNEYQRPEIHVVTSSATNNNDAQRRNAMAYKSWFMERMKTGVDKWYFEQYGNGEHLPKVKNMIDHIYDRTEDNDILMITNADICFVPGITGWILHEVERHEAVYFHRHDFPTIDKLLISEAEAGKGKWYCGSDTFAFTHKWWKQHKDLFPDMYFGREAWDMVMRNMIKRSGGVEIHNAIYHEKHKSYWENEGRDCAENEHNRKLASRWLSRYGGNWNDWKYNSQQLKEMYK